MEPRNPLFTNEHGSSINAGENPLRLASVQGWENTESSGPGAVSAYSGASEAWHRQLHEHHSGSSHGHHYHHHYVHHESNHHSNHDTVSDNTEESWKKYPIVDYTFRPAHPINVSLYQTRGFNAGFLTSSEHAHSRSSEHRSASHRWEQHSQVYSYGTRTHEHSRHHQSASTYSNSENIHAINFMTSPPSSFNEGGSFSFTHTFATAQHKIANLADRMADVIHTSGNCALGPRMVFGKLGYILPPVIATKQGEILEESRLFQKVDRRDVRPGDYGYRHWAPSVIKSNHNVDKGDAFFVAAVGSHGQLYGANDHHFIVPEDGGRYRNTTFLRPTAEFYKLYGTKLEA